MQRRFPSLVLSIEENLLVVHSQGTIPELALWIEPVAAYAGAFSIRFFIEKLVVTLWSKISDL